MYRAKYYRKPYTHWAIAAAKPSDAFAQPIVELYRIQIIPWNDLQNERHGPILKQEITPGREIVRLQEWCFGQKLGIYVNYIEYYDPTKMASPREAPLTPPSPRDTIENYDITNVVYTSWDSPNDALIERIRADQKCIKPIDVTTTYSLWGRAPVPLLLFTILLMPPATLVPAATSLQNMPHFRRTVRDSELGYMDSLTLYTESPDIYQVMTAAKGEAFHGSLLSSTEGDNSPDFLYQFSKRPTNAEFNEMMRSLSTPTQDIPKQ